MEQEVEVLENIQEIKLIGRKIGPYNEGEDARLRPWEASILEEKGLVEPIDDFSLAGIRKLVMREEKEKSLNDIPTYFYTAASFRIRKLKQEGEGDKAGKMREAIRSLVSLRVQKLLRMAVSSVVPDDIPPEEAFLINRISQDLEVWRSRLDRLFEENSKKEVDTHEGRVRRSIQGVIGKSADIQG